MTRNLRSSLSAAAVAALVTLTGAACSGGGSAAYCDDLKAAQTDFKDTGSALDNKETAQKLVATFKKIEGDAPAEVKAEWTSLRTVFEKLTADNPDLTALASEAEKMQSGLAKIEKHAKDTCNIDLNAS